MEKLCNCEKNYGTTEKLLMVVWMVGWLYGVYRPTREFFTHM